MHFSSHTIAELQGLNFAQRMQVIRKATDQLPTPKKLLLNLLKLAILIPLFMLIARYQHMADLVWIAALLLAYPLLTRPLTFWLCQPYLRQSRAQLKLEGQG
ncbi:DUF6170 family protein [Rheinheimera sp.]|uniref:DUF6170 family protein n=1 Tax=Rheinheimera sp. TaxID=1869214 RepID=UPI00307D6A2C